MVEQLTTIKTKVFLIKNKKFLDSNGQSNAANGMYPSNYGLYLSNSSLFSKLGNDIISSNGKMNQNQKNKMNVNAIISNQSLKNLKSNNNIGAQINGINPNGILNFLIFVFCLLFFLLRKFLLIF